MRAFNKLYKLCKKGDTDNIVKYYQENYINENRLKILKLVYVACRNGHLAAVKFLHDRYLFSNEEFKCNKNKALLLACLSNNVKLINWILLTFEYTKNEVLRSNNYIFRTICNNGCLISAKKLHEYCNFDRDELMMCNNYAFRRACKNGYTRTAAWLNELCEFSVEEISECNDYVNKKKNTNNDIDSDYNIAIGLLGTLMMALLFWIICKT